MMKTFSFKRWQEQRRVRLHSENILRLARAYPTYPERAERIVDRVLTREWAAKEERAVGVVLVWLVGVVCGVAWAVWGWGL
jgi:hypothetical protein